MGKGAAQTGAAPATLAELRERLREAQRNQDSEQVWLLRRAISAAADKAKVDRGGHRGS